MSPSWLYVGFTGHRKIRDPEGSAAAIRAALQRLHSRAGRPLAAVSSVASGGDTLFAEAAVEQKLPWVALLPFLVEEFRKDFKPAEWARAERLLALAKEIKIETKISDRNEAFLACGLRTVDSCDVLVALWSGEVAAGRGGTGDVVAYARGQQKPLVWIYSVTGATVEERLEKFPPPPPDISAATP